MPNAEILKGIHTIVNRHNVKPSYDYEQIAKSMITDCAIQPEHDPAEKFQEELNDIARGIAGIVMMTMGADVAMITRVDIRQPVIVMTIADIEEVAQDQQIPQDMMTTVGHTAAIEAQNVILFPDLITMAAVRMDRRRDHLLIEVNLNNGLMSNGVMSK